MTGTMSQFHRNIPFSVDPAGIGGWCRTGLFVPERDTLFVAVPHRGSQQAEIRAYQIK